MSKKVLKQKLTYYDDDHHCQKDASYPWYLQRHESHIAQNVMSVSTQSLKFTGPAGRTPLHQSIGV